MAGCGVKASCAHNETTPIGYEAMIDKVSCHDLHAKMLRILGFDHEKFTYPYQGEQRRLSNIKKPGTKVMKELLALTLRSLCEKIATLLFIARHAHTLHHREHILPDLTFFNVRCRQQQRRAFARAQWQTLPLMPLAA